MSTSTLRHRPRAGSPSSSRRRRARALVVLCATAAAAAGWLLAERVADVGLVVAMGGRAQSVSLASVVGTTLAAGILGWAVLALLEYRTRLAVPVWTAGAAGVAVLSLAGPLTAAATTASGVVLAGLHLLVAGILVPGLRRSSGRAGDR